MSKIYVFDLDGTICSVTNGNYKEATPIQSRISIINRLYIEGNVIYIYTARGMGTFNNQADLALEKWERITLTQLGLWGVRYNKLFMGKPAGDLYVDDKAMLNKDFFK